MKNVIYTSSLSYSVCIDLKSAASPSYLKNIVTKIKAKFRGFQRLTDLSKKVYMILPFRILGLILSQIEKKSAAQAGAWDRGQCRTLHYINFSFDKKPGHSAHELTQVN